MAQVDSRQIVYHCDLSKSVDMNKSICTGTLWMLYNKYIFIKYYSQRCNHSCNINFIIRVWVEPILLDFTIETLKDQLKIFIHKNYLTIGTNANILERFLVGVFVNFRSVYFTIHFQ